MIASNKRLSRVGLPIVAGRIAMTRSSHGRPLVFGRNSIMLFVFQIKTPGEPEMRFTIAGFFFALAMFALLVPDPLLVSVSAAGPAADLRQDAQKFIDKYTAQWQ